MEAWGHHRYLGSTFSLHVLWVRQEEQMSLLYLEELEN